MTAKPSRRTLHAVKPATGLNSVVCQPQGDQTWCEANRAVFLTLLNAPPAANASEQRHRDYEEYTSMARDWCANKCPRFAECLQAALSGPGIDGFVAGTTETERNRLRETCGIEPTKVDMDHASGVKLTAGQTFDVDATAAMIAAHPQASDREIAAMLGMAAVTVKRHRHKIAATEAARAEAEAETSHDTAPDAVEAWQQMFSTA